LKQIKGMDLTDVQWGKIRPLVEFGQQRRADNRGRPWRDARQVLNGMLWVLRTGAPWHDLPTRYGPYQTCHRRFQRWQRSGVLNGILWALAEDLLARGQLGLEETFIDASFMGAKKGAMALVERSSAKGASSWQSQTAMVFLSPSGLGALRRMSKSSSRLRSSTALWPTSPND